MTPMKAREDYSVMTIIQASLDTNVTPIISNHGG